MEKNKRTEQNKFIRSPTGKILFFLFASGALFLIYAHLLVGVNFKPTDSQIAKMFETDNSTIGQIYHEEYKVRFERMYNEDIILGNIDFNTAYNEFAQSNESKIVIKKYITAKKESFENPPFSSMWKLELFGLLKAFITLIPLTLGMFVVEGILLFGIIWFLKYIYSLLY